MAKITFQKHTVKVTNKYHCACGKKFSRQLSDWFTVNPFNTGTPKEISDRMRKALEATRRNCPKCQESVLPEVQTITAKTTPDGK
jgi:hypothetical protein